MADERAERVRRCLAQLVQFDLLLLPVHPLAEHLVRAHRKWATGIYLLWYPIKDTADTERFARQVAGLGLPKILRAELRVAAPRDKALIGSGLLLVNPPWRLETELQVLLPALAVVLRRDREAATRLDWLAAEK